MMQLLIAILLNVFNVFKIYVECISLMNDAENVRVIGGEPASDGQYPFQVSLRYLEKNQHFCGGSILNLYWIMTAAHCFDSYTSSSTVAVAGTNYLDKVGASYNISEIILHDDYQKQNHTNDIAVLKIDGRISYNINVRPVALANHRTFVNSIISESSPCTLSGWGYTSESGESYSNELQYVTIAIINNTECLKYELNVVELPSSNICTYLFGKRACWGDSGGPLICRGQQYGIVSKGKSCRDSPDIYTSLVDYRPWIRYITGA